jgi:hypothetical protein
VSRSLKNAIFLISLFVSVPVWAFCPYAFLIYGKGDIQTNFKAGTERAENIKAFVSSAKKDLQSRSGNKLHSYIVTDEFKDVVANVKVLVLKNPSEETEILLARTTPTETITDGYVDVRRLVMGSDMDEIQREYRPEHAEGHAEFLRDLDDLYTRTHAVSTLPNVPSRTPLQRLTALVSRVDDRKIFNQAFIRSFAKQMLFLKWVDHEYQTHFSLLYVVNNDDAASAVIENLEFLASKAAGKLWDKLYFGFDLEQSANPNWGW